MFNRKKYLGLSILSLLLGLLVYLLFKRTSCIHLTAEHIFGVSFGMGVKSEFINNHLCDFLWAYALTCGLIFVLGDALRYRAWCSAVSVGYGFLWELLQYYGVVPGTGDWLDILFYFAAGLTAVFMFPKRRGKNEKDS